MRFDVLTLFPEMFDITLGDSIIGRARQAGLIELNTVQIRDFALNKHKSVDDYPYGGGPGMVMQAQPIYDAYMSVIKELDYRPRVIYMTPQGKTFNQEMAKSLAQEKHLIILCGHYEGIDERVIEEIVTDEISIGDYVLTGGELPAMVLIDSTGRLVPGVLAEGSCEQESFSQGLLEYPQYTRPSEFMGKQVPEVLLSGHHANIEKWRHEQALERTARKRPELLKDKANT
ncbi:MAG: tRNA (guanosine(37)-N1)-methyltransferase TrmD [Deltaproteobacteria bacterium]